MFNANNRELQELLEQERRTRVAMLGMLEDIQEQKNSIQKANKEWFDTMDSIEDGIMLHDKNYLILRVNRAYKELSGASKFKDIIGKEYWRVFPKLNAPMDSCTEAVEIKNEHIEEFTLPDGRIFQSKAYPVLDKEAKYSYSIHVFEDITQRINEQQKIKELNKTLELIRKCNETLVRAQSQRSLIEDICHEITANESYSFAALFLKSHDSIKCIYYSFPKFKMQDIYDIDFSNEKYKTHPIVASIELQKTIIIDDIKNDKLWGKRLQQHKELFSARSFDMEGSMLCQYLEVHDIEGVLAVYSKDKAIFDDSKVALFKELAEDMAYGIHHHRIQERLKETTLLQNKSLHLLKDSFRGTIEAVSKMTEMRDPYTAGHQHRVAKLSVAIAKELGLAQETIEAIELAAMVHDIGKVQIPLEILIKPTTLTDLEYEIIKNHSQAGYDILKDIKFLYPIAKIILQHHEKLDGSGYPNKLKGNEILLEAKIISVADVVEAMASHRPYRASLGVDFAPLRRLKSTKVYGTKSLS
ncbi:MAG: HD domain-containing protein [Sulfurimonas sp.]|uniref:HD domain-containing phosphohydrolase n=1 Tax=Sulfurimonas sp. TaxID=2022749 RepID=UPI0028CF02C0|nr:HD domain-containing phosphohydrolase [Sulfurimonas sp.]MDT8338635.1 HD domain-containing protein [Sulfurimonas sp.]